MDGAQDRADKIKNKALAREIRKHEKEQAEIRRQAKRDVEKEIARENRNKAQANIERAIWDETKEKAEKALEIHITKKGRPLSLTDIHKEEILVKLSNGLPLSAICRQDNMPDIVTVYNEMQRDAVFFKNYIRAREVLSHTLIYDTLVIADDSSGDLIENKETGEKTPNHARIQRDRIRIDTRFRVAGKVNPVYADKAPAMAIGDGANVTVNAVTVSGRDLSPDDRQKLREMLLAARADQAKVIDN